MSCLAMSRPVSIPKDELDQFALAVSQAHRWAEEDSALRGFLLLRQGLRRARVNREPFSGELTELWLRGLERFRTSYPEEWFPGGR